MPIFWLSCGLIVILLLHVFAKVNTMLSLMFAAFLVAFLNGMSPDKALASITTGFGNTLGSLGIIVAFGAVIGKLMTDSGASYVFARKVIDLCGVKYIRLAVAIIGLVYGIAMYYEVAFLMLAPIVLAIASEAKIPWLKLVIPAVCATTVSHSLLPPQPGPVSVIAAFHAEPGRVWVTAIPLVILWVVIGGYVWPALMKNGDEELPNALTNPPVTGGEARPSFLLSLLVPLTPPLLMISVTTIKLWLKETNPLYPWVDFVGSPVIAMGIAMLLAMTCFGLKRARRGTWVTNRFNDAIATVANIVMIIGAGGGLTQVAIDSGISDYIHLFLTHHNVSPYLTAWGLTVIFRITTGQGVVSAVAVSGMMSAAVIDPATGLHLMPIHPVLLVLATLVGSNFMTHINDVSFWLFTEYFKLPIRTSLKIWGGMLSFGSLVGLAYIMILSFFWGSPAPVGV